MRVKCRRIRLGVPIALLGLGVVSQLPGPAAAQEEDLARIVAESYDRSLNAADLEGMMALYAEDAVVMPPGEPALMGLAEIRAWKAGHFDEAGGGGGVTRTEVDEVEVAGDWGFASGTWTLAEGGAEVSWGHWLTVARRQADGRWAIAREIWTVDDASTAGG